MAKHLMLECFSLSPCSSACSLYSTYLFTHCNRRPTYLCLGSSCVPKFCTSLRLLPQYISAYSKKRKRPSFTPCSAPLRRPSFLFSFSILSA
ncbi:hypothetical protein BJY52DRAFT_361551 [Lactarius psammicola]|nr:hypothetical protein BJY52DRAFT_361551 [Lactarius psammicola]